MALSLFFVVNVLGNIPLFIGLLARYPLQRQRIILLREFTFALIILLLFNFFGSHIFSVLGIAKPVVGIAGGFLLLIIAMGMIFPKRKKEEAAEHEPMLVPLATPVIAGPGSITSVMLFSSKIDNHLITTVMIISVVAISYLTAIIASNIKHILGEKGLLAFEKMGGMILCLIGVQMFTTGVIQLVKENFAF